MKAQIKLTLLTAALVGGWQWVSQAESLQSVYGAHVVPVGFMDSIRNALKSPADKASDADKLEFMRREGECADGDCGAPNAAGKVQLTDRGNAIFNRMKSVYNEQYSILKRGYQPIGPDEGRMLEGIQEIVNRKIVTMRESCKDVWHVFNNQGDQISYPVSCGFVSEAEYVVRSGQTYFASEDGRKILRAIASR